MSKFSRLSDSELREQIHRLEAQGYIGRTNPLLHALNCAQTDRMSVAELMRVVAERESRGQGADKARAALRRRGYNY